MNRFINRSYKDSALTSKVINCSIEVHKHLGRGFHESLYRRALAYELKLASLEFKEEFNFNIYYKQQIIGVRRMDFLIEDRLMIEIKAVSELEDWHLAQALNYLEAYNMDLGLLINFGANTIEVKRLMRRYKDYKRELHR